MSTAIAKTGGGFSLQPQNIAEAMQIAEMLSKSQMVPKNYQGKPQDTLVAMMMGAELGLNPIQSLANIAVINGKGAVYGDALLALVQNHPRFGGHEESFDEATMTATCTVWRKGDAQKHVVTFSKADAEKASLWSKQGPWTQYPKRMLMWRARGYALRDKFADALGGLITVEEARDIPEQDMGNAQRHEKPKESRPELEYYPAESFGKNFEKWQTIVESGKKSAGDIVAMLESKAVLSDEQREQILALEAGVEA